MMDTDQPISHRHLDGFASEPHPDLVELGSEADLPVTANLAGRRRFNQCRVDCFGVVLSSETEPFPRDDIANPLMAALEIVFTHPPVYLGLCILDTVEHLVGKELLAQRLMPTLNLACRCRRPRSGQNMFDTVLPADPVKQDLTRPGAESAGEHLPVVGQDLLRDTMSCHCYTQSVTHRSSSRPAHHQS